MPKNDPPKRRMTIICSMNETGRISNKVEITRQSELGALVFDCNSYCVIWMDYKISKMF